MSGDEILISPELLKRSYTQLFSEQIPEVLFYQRDRPHYYNLLLKIIFLFILLSVIVPLTLLPLYPVLSVLLSSNFSVTKAFGGGKGTMNLHWIGVLYLYYALLATGGIGGAASGTGNVADQLGGGMFIGLFMALTPLTLLLTWYYAMPMTPHDMFAEIYNSIYRAYPLLPGGVAYSTMRCPAEVITRIEECKGPMDGGARGGDFRLFGMGISDMVILGLMGILLTLVLMYVWSSRLERRVGELNTPSKEKTTLKFRITPGKTNAP